MESQLRNLSRPRSDQPSSSSRPLPDRPSSAHPTYGEPGPLKLCRKVFLSHSGVNKNFVGFLYKELCRRYSGTEIAFYDVESLPKATAISMENILDEARSSKLGVLVLTEDFFMKTPNPMRELEAFVASEVRLLPLFLGMSVDEFKKKSRRAKWEKQWRKWSAKQLGGSSVKETIKKWRGALDIVNNFSGLEYCKVAKTEPEYVDLIVKTVTRIIPPLILFSDEQGVRGKDRLCQIVDDMYKECASNRLSVDRTTQATFTHTSSSRGEADRDHKMSDVVGIYGFLGMGKTTLSRSLHDFYFEKFNGKVCYLDLGCPPSFDQGSFSKCSVGALTNRMQRMLSTFTDYDSDFCYSLHVDQVKQLLRKQLSFLTDPIFLAIDMDILRTEFEEAEFYLSCEFPEGSKIFITSRSQDVLKKLTNQCDRFSVVINYMPPLLFEEARDIFIMHGMPNLHRSELAKIEDEVTECLKMCIFESHSWHPTHYHPLLLKMLAASLEKDRYWKENLRMLQSQGIVHTNDALENVFKILDFTFATFSKEDQILFLDFALCVTKVGFRGKRWIKRLYLHIDKNRLRKIFSQLKEVCFIEEKSLKPPKLVAEFCRYKLKQGEYAQYYEVVEGNACWRDVIPRSVRYISISGCRDSLNPNGAWVSLDLRDVEALEVLHLVGIYRSVEVLLSHTTCARLRSLIVKVPPGMSLHFIMDGVPMQPHGLFWLELEGNADFKSSRHFERFRSICNAGFQALRRLVLTATPIPMMDLSSSVLGAFWNLEYVSLSELPSVRSIDVMTCSNLRRLTLRELPYLRSIGGLNNLTSFEELDLSNCNQLPTLTIGAKSHCYISVCRSLKRVSLCPMASYPGAESGTRQRNSATLICGCPSLKNVDGLLQFNRDYFHTYDVSLEETFGDLLEAAAIDSSICKAKVNSFLLVGSETRGLAGLYDLHLLDAQHIGPLISALTTAVCLTRFQDLHISCKKAGECGCDKDAPQFSPFGSPHLPFDLRYRCSQVRDLGSLAHWESLRTLVLKGCRSVELWPDFATLTGLTKLDLSFTSLKERPASLLLLRHLMFLSIEGCTQIPAEDLMKGIDALHEIHLTRGHISCVIGSLQSLSYDLTTGERDRCSVADALDSSYEQLVALFHRCSLYASPHHIEGVLLSLQIMYGVWFGGEKAAHVSISEVIATKLSRLLCSEKILSFPFHFSDWSESLSAHTSHSEDEDRVTNVTRCGVVGVALIGASIGWYKAAANDGLLKDSIIPFLKWFTHVHNHEVLWQLYKDSLPRKVTFWLFLRKRVGEGVCKVARVPSVAAELGPDFLNNFIQPLEAKWGISHL